MSANRREQISVSNVALVESVKNLKYAFNRHLHLDVVKDRNIATMRDFHNALAHTVWDQLCSRWIRTQQYHKMHHNDVKHVYYLSMEFCMGRTLSNTMLNVDITNQMDEALYQLGLDVEELEEIEADTGLGNGGLGRLAACFLDSMATLGLAAYGQGIRYEHGAFHQVIQDGWQIEESDEWLQFGNPWEIERPDDIQNVHFGGRVIRDPDDQRARWVDTETIVAIPYDTPIPGYQNNTCNSLRLWAAKASKNLDLHTYFSGNYINAILARNQAENISRVLYPIDHNYEGKLLRLRQEHFLVSASIQDIIRRFRQTTGKQDLFELPYKAAIHINDTHPALAIPELMRILLDEEGLVWTAAWEICYRTFTHTNHVAQTEMLKHWPTQMLKDMLPRHYEIIEEINEEFQKLVNRRWPNDLTRFQRMAIIRRPGRPVVSMDHLCIVGSHCVNGVSMVQTNHLRTVLFKDFVDLWPTKFVNKTNGITPRRWLVLCNPGLADVLTDALQGDESWITNLTLLTRLKSQVDVRRLRSSLMRAKMDHKHRFTAYMKTHRRCFIDPGTLFDVMVKRVDEYKRHLLMCLHIMTMYNRIKADPKLDICSRTFILGGNAAPGNRIAKLIIKLINCLGNVINCDPQLAGRLKVIFLTNYQVSLAERIVPAADLSEQIPCVGTEAAGTGNMKFMLNGALTIGTRDGANVEIFEEVGAENAFIFGRTLDEVKALRAKGYHPQKFIAANEELAGCVEQLRSGYFNPETPDLFQDLYKSLTEDDRFLVCADYEDYLRAQADVDRTYRCEDQWSRMMLWNIASAGKFSSDRAVTEYALEMWNVEPRDNKLPRPSEPMLTRKLPRFYIGI